MPASRPLRRLVVLSLLGTLAALSACKDQRGDLTSAGSGSIDGDGLFLITRSNAAIFAFQNWVTDRVVEIELSGTPTPVFEVPCDGSGSLSISEIAPSLYEIIAIDFIGSSNQVAGCRDRQFVVTMNGRMTVEIVTTAPDLLYQIFMPFRSFVYDIELFGGATFEVSGFVNGKLDGGESGLLGQKGTLRVESLSQGVLAVSELDLLYDYDRDVSTTFAPWPGGSLETSLLAQGLTTFPLIIEFDGFGGASYSFQGRRCDVSLADEVNPCEGL